MKPTKKKTAQNTNSRVSNFLFEPILVQDTTGTPPRHNRDTTKTHRDTTETPPRHHQDTSETQARHKRDTTETHPRHHRDTNETPPGHHRDTTKVRPKKVRFIGRVLYWQCAWRRRWPFAKGSYGAGTPPHQAHKHHGGSQKHL